MKWRSVVFNILVRNATKPRRIDNHFADALDGNASGLIAFFFFLLKNLNAAFSR